MWIRISNEEDEIQVKALKGVRVEAEQVARLAYRVLRAGCGSDGEVFDNELKELVEIDGRLRVLFPI